MTFKRKELTITLKKMIEATENNEINTSEQFLDELKKEISGRKIITLKSNSWVKDCFI